ncbi:hypothetical protein QTO34_002354 [Cnephaeus nilssonii]|uniref:Calponin-homology (CH) domain-containing protein n=1 Tax=Cnephaeus nilssonii TaxID=3371016 RepID=A0AA40HUI2_CNENI|nr:hypothetical protein QTO34_002354 [Eptesicus nilssonii]
MLAAALSPSSSVSVSNPAPAYSQAPAEGVCKDKGDRPHEALPLGGGRGSRHRHCAASHDPGFWLSGTYPLSSMQFNKGFSYRLSAEVKNWLLSKHDPQEEAELRSWMEGLTGLSMSPNFRKGLKDGTILCTLVNKLPPNSVSMINCSMQTGTS